MKAQNTVSSKIKFIGLAALATLAFATANPALARDIKVYAGTECEVLRPDLDQTKFLAKSLRGGVQNASSRFAIVQCPVVRDTAADITATVQVVDRNTIFDIDCRLMSVARNGSTLGESRRTSNSSFSNVLPLNFNSRVKGQSGASIHFRCALPPAQQGRMSEIVSYEIVELN